LSAKKYREEMQSEIITSEIIIPEIKDMDKLIKKIEGNEQIVKDLKKILIRLKIRYEKHYKFFISSTGRYDLIHHLDCKDNKYSETIFDYFFFFFFLSLSSSLWRFLIYIQQ